MVLKKIPSFQEVKDWAKGSNIDHSEIANQSASDHHARYADTEAVSAVEGSVDAANLDGSSGTDGQFLKTDGSNATWADNDIDLLSVTKVDDLPDVSNVSKPTIAYVENDDEYVGIFQE